MLILVSTVGNNKQQYWCVNDCVELTLLMECTIMYLSLSIPLWKIKQTLSLPNKLMLLWTLMYSNYGTIAVDGICNCRYVWGARGDNVCMCMWVWICVWVCGYVYMCMCMCMCMCYRKRGKEK